MITVVTENEVYELLDLTNKLIETCKKNSLFTKNEIRDMEDFTYYFERAFKNKDYDFEGIITDDEDDDDDEDYEDDEDI